MGGTFALVLAISALQLRTGSHAALVTVSTLRTGAVSVVLFSLVALVLLTIADRTLPKPAPREASD